MYDNSIPCGCSLVGDETILQVFLPRSDVQKLGAEFSGITIKHFDGRDGQELTPEQKEEELKMKAGSSGVVAFPTQARANPNNPPERSLAEDERRTNEMDGTHTRGA